ncbi:MAG TPA: hypothetical protein VHO01_14390 [Jatrophihabitans sp.]|nr:hypothetical protein [Jatrophihabitans sp.]
MASRHTGLARLGLSALLVLVAALLLAGCGSSSGVHTQTLTSDPPSSASVSPTPSTSVTTSTASPTKSHSGIPTPTVTVPGAQDAVNAYIAFYNASGAADRDPTNANVVAIDGYLTGKAKTLFDSNYASMKQSGLAYRGTAPDPRVKVQQVFSDTSVFLESCPLESKTDPYIEYTVSTGKPVATGATRNPPPPYLLILPMVKVGGQWQLSDVLPNTSKTCTG